VISGTAFAVFTTGGRFGITTVLGSAGISTTVMAGVEDTKQQWGTGFR